MHKIAWQSVRKNGGLGRASINHYTFDGKVTLCNKKIPGTRQLFRLDAFGPDECAKCSERKMIVEASLKSAEDKIDSFKQTVETLGGIYELKDGMHIGSWKNPSDLYYAYGLLVNRSGSGDWLNLTDNKLYFKPAKI